MEQSRTGRPLLLTVVFGLIPGLSYGPPRTPLPLLDVGGRLHGDGSTWALLRLPIAEFRGEGSSGGSGSREVRVCLRLAAEELGALWRCFLPLPHLPGHCSRSSSPRWLREVCWCPRLRRHFRSLNPAFSAVLGSLSHFSFSRTKGTLRWLQSFGWKA